VLHLTGMALFAADDRALSEEHAQELLSQVLWWSLFTTVVSAVLGALLSGRYGLMPAMLAPTPVQGLSLLALRRFKARRVAVVYLVVVSLFFFAGALADRGTSGQSYYGLVLVVQATALFFGLRGALMLAPLVALQGLVLVAIEAQGALLPSVPRSPIEGLLIPWSGFVLIAAGSIILHRKLSRSLGQAQSQALVTARANTQLSREIERRVQVEHELHASMERALAASRLKSSFLANVSHELRTPMNAVVGLTDLLLRQNPSPQQAESLETIRTSSEALLALLDDILDLSKIESGALQFESLPYGPGVIATDVCKLLSARAQARGVTLSCEVAEGTPAAVLGDPTRVRQILLNLVGNAVKFTSQGQIVVRVSFGDARVRLSVRDTGIGISKDQQARIFEPFVQADASTTRRFGGTGLGLAIVHRLVDAQGGALTLESEPGKGSCFTVVLPATPARGRGPPSSGALPVVPAPGLSSLSVLLAEDNPINERVALKLLEHLGVTADVARNGLEALERCGERAYDVVLMDMQMPELDGLEATRQLRARHGRAMRVIALTANAMPEDRGRAKDAGCDDFLAKPVRLEDLSRVLSRATVPRKAVA